LELQLCDDFGNFLGNFIIAKKQIIGFIKLSILAVNSWAEATKEISVEQKL
jgi:hypothetical protein